MANYKNAQAGDQNVMIRKTSYHYYNGEKRGWVRQDDEIMIFENYEDALQWVNEAENTEYILENDEYRRPDYRIIKK